MIKVPFLSLDLAYKEISQEIDGAINSVIQSSGFIGGKFLKEFEQNFAEYTEADYCVGVANGLDAIQLALKAMNIGHGDEVLVPSNTFIATWLAVTNTGAIPVPIEPNESQYTIDITKIESAITNKTKAIIPVHLYGQPADMDSILEISKACNLYTIEDAAQAHGSEYKGKRIGSHGDVVAWSFYPGKNLGAFGDGGAITTNNQKIADQIRTIGNYGSKNKYINDLMGVNSRLDPIQAAILDVKLKYLNEWNQRRRSIAKIYFQEIRKEDFILPTGIELENSAWHLFPIRHKDRDRVMLELSKKNIETLVHYPVPPHQQKIYKKEFSKFNLPIAENLSRELISLPIGPHMNLAQIEHVIKSINLI